MASCATCLHKNVHPNVCSDCLCGTHFKPRIKTQTNADRIRAMSDEELATTLYLLRLDALRLEGFEGFIETKDEVLDWLKEEAESEGEDG